MKKIINITIVLLTIITITILSLVIYKLKTELTDFKINGVIEKKNSLYLDIEHCRNAINYDVIIYNDKGEIIFEKISKNNLINISDLILENNQKVKIEVTAISRKNKKKKAIKKYIYTNKYASFKLIKDHFSANDKNIILNLVGYNEKDKYKIKLFYKGNEIYKNDNITNNIIIDNKDFKEYTGRITVNLYNSKNRIVSITYLYFNTIEVGDFKITSPSTETTIDWGDLDLYYEGGENATTLNIKLYTNDRRKKFLNSMTVAFEENHIVIPASLFKENTSYFIRVTASYNDYNEIGKSSSIVLHVLDKPKVKPVYVNKNFTFVLKDTEVELLTDTKDATIYYTVNGEKPTTTSLVYAKPIKIVSDTKIRAFAVKENEFDSDITEYDFKVKNKNLVIYLSPSNQWANLGVSEVGYTTEKEQMNKLADYLKADLEKAGIKVYRNNPKAPGGMNTWLRESNSVGADFHFAIHSNASIAHDKKGMEIYVDHPTSNCFAIASNIYRNLYEIYPDKNPETNRGVKFANGSLGEANDNYSRCSALIEVAFHDNKDDAAWIVDNMESIAQNMADSILDFYQISR